MAFILFIIQMFIVCEKGFFAITQAIRVAIELYLQGVYKIRESEWP